MAMVANIQDRVDLLTQMNQGLPSLDGRRVESPTYSLKEMRSHHREIVRLLVAGLRPSEIAERLNIHKQTVINVRNNPIVMRQIKMLQDAKDVEASKPTALDDLRPNAVQALSELVDDVDEKAKAVRLSAAREILDRTDGKPVQRHDIQKTSIILEQILILKERARSAGVLDKVDTVDGEEVEDAKIIEVGHADSDVDKEDTIT